MTSTVTRRIGALAVWLAACGAIAIGLGVVPLAQGIHSGTIRGTVVDVQRAPIRSVTVTLTSPALQGRRTGIPREDGSYGFWQLPPGDYEITFEAPAFAPVTRRTEVLLGLSVELNVTLHDERAAPGQRQQVAETPARIAGPTIAAHFSRGEIDALATPRTLFGIAQLAPGLTTTTPNADRVAIHGAVAFDNVFMMNGVDVSDNLFGSPQNLFIEEAIEETAVLTSGVSAAYGRFSGGVVSAITRSGGNRYSGSYRANLSNPRWTTQTPFELCDAAVTLASCKKANPRLDTLQAWHESTLGGFIVKDRLWFFSAGRLSEISNTTQLPLSGVTNTETTSNQRGQVKITSTVAAGHIVTFDALTNLTTSTGHPAFAYTVDRDAIGKQTLPNYYYLSNYRAAIGKKALVEAQFSHRRFERRDVGAISRSIVDSPMLTRTISTAGSPAHYNAPYFDVTDPEKRNAFQGAGNVTYLMTTSSAGRHEINGGYEFFRSQHAGGDSQTATGYVYETNYLTETGSTAPLVDASSRFIPLWIPGTTLIENWLPVRGSTLNVDTQSIYLQDHWAINGRLSADVGVRQERVRSSATGIFTGVDRNTVMPRVAVGYNLDDHGRHVVHVTYGHYAGRFPETLLGKNTSVGNPDLWLGVYVGPVGQGRSFAPGFDPLNYLTVAGRFPIANVAIEDGLASPLVKEFTTSYGIDLMNGRGFVQAAFIRRDWSGFIEDDIAIANGTTHVVRSGFDVGTLTNVVYQNSKAAVREYQALEFQGRYRAGPRWTLNGNYTLQLRNQGNDPGEDVNAPGSTSPLGDYPEIFSADRHYPNGRLSTFQRHKVRLWSVYDLDLGRAGALSLSGLARVDSGRVYSLSAEGQPLTAIQTARLIAAGYPNLPSSQTIFFGGRGSQVFNGYGVVDLALGYAIPLFKGVKPWLKLEIYNALNNQKLIAWDTTVTQDNASATDALGLRTGYRTAASFGKATSNEQFPAPFQGETGGRTFRLAAGFRF
jgi:outer membrane receptor protein involved in Fe transport